MSEAPEGAAGLGSPAEVATAWVQAVMDRADLGAAWPLTDPTLRLVLAQHWIWTNQGVPAVSREDRDELARALAACPSSHPLWGRFASQRIRRWREHWQGFTTLTWTLMDRQERLRPDLEVVSFAERKRLEDLDRPGPPLVTRRLAVRRTPSGWLVAGLDGTALFEPGWPPAQVSP